jgi:hypothetical protein
MIAKTKTGDSFRGLANYLEQEKKIAFKETRNLTGDYKDHYVRMMEESASLSSRAEEPVYHMSLSYSPKDNPNKADMLEDADQVLEKMGLDEHQAVIVAHNDEKFEHLHIMVNRVHPWKGKAWERWNDWDRVRPILRDIEKQRGYERVSDRNWGKGKGLTNGEIHQWKKHELDNPPLKIKAEFYNFKGGFEQAKSWKDIEDFLKEAGCRIKPKGRGGVIEDRATGKQLKLSRVDRKFSFGELQKEHGNYKEWQQKEIQQKREEAHQRKVERDRKQALRQKKTAINNRLRHPEASEDENPYRRVKRSRGFESWDRVEQTLEGINLEIVLEGGTPYIIQTATGKGVSLGEWEEGANKLTDFNAQQYQSLFNWKANKVIGRNRDLSGREKKVLKGFVKALAQGNEGEEAEATQALKKALYSKNQVKKVISLFKTLAKLSGPTGRVATLGQSVSKAVLSEMNQRGRSRGRDHGIGL